MLTDAARCDSVVTMYLTHTRVGGAGGLSCFIDFEFCLKLNPTKKTPLKTGEPFVFLYFPIRLALTQNSTHLVIRRRLLLCLFVYVYAPLWESE